MSGNLAQNVHFVKGIDPVDDAFAATKYTDVVNMKAYSKATFLIYWGVGATGTTTITALAGDDVANPPTNSTAIPFRYKRVATTDTETAWTTATTSGFLTTAGSSQIYIVEVDSSEIGDTGYNYLCLKFVEGTDSPILGGVMILLHGARFAQDVPATALT